MKTEMSRFVSVTDRDCLSSAPSAEYMLGCQQLIEWHAHAAEERLERRLAELRRKRIMTEYRAIYAVPVNERSAYQQKRFKRLARVLWEIGR